MEDSARRKRRDLIQNIAIVALSLSAVLLFAQSQIYNLISDHGGLTDRLSGTSAADTSQQATALTAPVRVAVTGLYDRYGSFLTTDAEAFSDLGLLLKESLGSAGTLIPCQETEFVSALNASSVFYDFLSPLPLAILSELVGGGEGDFLDIQARQLVLSAQEESVHLYVWDGKDRFLSCTVIPVSQEDLTEIINSCTLPVVLFAFDEDELDETYAQIAPRSLLPAELPELPVLSASNPLTDTDQLLTGLRFNPSTKNRYTDANGTEIIRETDRSLQISSGGTIVYEGGTEPVVEIQAAADVPSLLEAVSGAWSLLRTLLGDLPGEAALYLEAVNQNEEITTLRFSYHVDGVPIHFSDGGSAAEVTLTGTTVTRLSLRFRQYTASGETSLLLPLRQALAIAAADHKGAELSIGYADGGAAVSAQWMAE